MLRTEKIGGVYCVSNALGGGMKNVEKTGKQIEALHGEVSVFELNKPHVYEVFESWPEDIQREYLQKLCWTHGGTQQKVADMLGVDLYTVQKAIKSLSVPWRDKAECARHRGEMNRRWEAFLRGGTLIKDAIPKETANELVEFSKKLETERAETIETSNAAEKRATDEDAPTQNIFNLRKNSTVASAMYCVATLCVSSLRGELASALAAWIGKNPDVFISDVENVRRAILRGE